MPRRGFWSSPTRHALLLAPIAGQSVLTIAVAVAYAFPKRIPIGVLFDEESAKLDHTSFRLELDRHNSFSSTEFKVDRWEKKVDITDSVNMSKTMCQTMSRGIFAIYGVTDLNTIATIDSFSKTFHMPFVTTSIPIRDPCNCLPSSSPMLASSSSSSSMHMQQHQHAFQSSYSAYWPSQPHQHRQPSTSSPLEPLFGGGDHGPGPGGSTDTADHAATGYGGDSGRSPSTGDYLLYMRPFYDQPVLSVIQYYRWKRILYLYDTDAGLYRLEQLHNAINNGTVALEINWLRIVDVDNCYVALRRIDVLPGDKHIVLDFDTLPVLESVLRQIQNVGMHRNGYHYLIGGLVIDQLDLMKFRYGGVNITGFRLIDPEIPAVQALRREWYRLNQTWQGVTMGTTLQMDAMLAVDAAAVVLRGLTSLLHHDADRVRSIFRRGQVYNNETRGIECRSHPPTPWTLGPFLMKHLKSVRMNGLTGPIAFDENGYRTEYKLDVIELVFNNDPRKIGIWNSSTGLSVKRHSTASDERDARRSTNSTRIVTTIKSLPFLIVKNDPEDGPPLEGNDRFEGFCADLARKLAAMIGIEYELKLVSDGKYGANEQNGSWNGMVGELTRWEADIAIAPLTITSQRERVVDFSKPFMQLGISIMIKKPEKQKPGVFSFMDPLSLQIWMCIVISYLGVSVVLFLVSRFSPYEWQVEETASGPTFTNDFTMLNSLWFALGAFMQQGCEMSPRSVSGRVAGSAWWFFTLIIISTYTANLAAFLTVERMLTPIESADDLVKQTEIMYGTLDAGSTKDFFRTSKISVYEKMWNYMNSHQEVFVSTTDDGVAKVRISKGKYAFLLESTMNEYHNQRKPCNTMKIGENLDSKGYGVATPIDSDLKDSIGLAVLLLREAGDLQKLHKKWWYDKGECSPEGDSKGGSSQSALTLSNVAGIFYILISGLGLSMVASLFEFLLKSRRLSNSKGKKPVSEFVQSGSNEISMNITSTDCKTPEKHQHRHNYQEVLFEGHQFGYCRSPTNANSIVGGFTSVINSPVIENTMTKTSTFMSRSSLV